ncbi:MAG: beta strand repeat-containing protein, partial [Planctomycetota bacterium]
LLDDAGGRFAINSSTGVVTVANGSLLDREAAASHNITVRVTDTAGATYSEVMTVTITDVDEFDVGAVSDSNAAANSLAENSANGTAVGITASASDADATTNTITYTLDNNSFGRFAINSSTGVVTVANSSLLNYEAATSHSITVRATSADGSWSTQTYTISLTDVDEFDVGAVTDTETAANSVVENSANGTTVGITASASDADATTKTITYTLDNSAGGRFAINSSTGVVTVANSSLLDREAAASHSITVRATSADGSWSTQSFTINLTDVDEFDVGAVTDGNAAANSVAENSANGTAVGLTASASDADATTNTITYTLDDTAGGRFAINSSTGVVTVANGSLLDFETATSHNITVRATSADGSWSTQTFTINLTNVNETPTAVADTAIAVEAGGVSNGTAGTNPSGNVLTNDTDVDAGDTKAVTGVAAGTVGSASGNVASNVTGTYGSINISANGTYTYTVDNSNAAVQALRTSGNTLTDTFTYTMRDAAGLTSTTQVTLTIQGANDAPHDLLGALSIAENAANGSAVGTLTRSDVDSGDTATYSLVDDAGGRFAINSSTGVVTVANGSLLDREAAASHNITVRVTDTAGATYDEVMTVTITDVDEFDIGAVSDTNAAANSLAENSANGTAVGITASATDADATAVITYTLDDNSGGRFAINSSTGIVTVANSSLLNYEAATSHSITVRATSSDGSWSTQAFTINLTDVNESVGPVSDVNAATNSVIENSVNGTTVGLTALAIDQDATNNTVSYSLDDSAGGRFAIDSSTGVVTVANSSLLDREAAASHSIIVRATSVDGSWSTQSFTISLTDVDEFDVGAVTDGNAAANSVAENSANGTTVGITASASDADATTNTISYTLDDTAGGRFAINSSTGVVTVANGSLLDFETTTSHNITVRATSADGSWSTQTFTLNVTNVNETPTAVADTATAVEAGGVSNGTAGTNPSGNVLTNDTDVDAGDTQTVTGVAAGTVGSASGNVASNVTGTYGAITIAANGTYTYTVDNSNAAVQALRTSGNTLTDTFTYTMRDAAGLTSTTQVTITIQGANDAPHDLLGALSIAENAANGSAVGTITRSDVDSGDTATYSLVDDAGGRFAIN